MAALWKRSTSRRSCDLSWILRQRAGMDYLEFAYCASSSPLARFMRLHMVDLLPAPATVISCIPVHDSGLKEPVTQRQLFTCPFLWALPPMVIERVGYGVGAKPGR
jgi:hypothetical protein